MNYYKIFCFVSLLKIRITKLLVYLEIEIADIT